VVSTLFDVVAQLRNLEQRQRQPVSYRISGRLSLADSMLSIPFEQQGELGGSIPSAPGSGDQSQY